MFDAGLCAETVDPNGMDNSVRIGLFQRRNAGTYYLKRFVRSRVGVRPGTKIRDVSAWEIDSYVCVYLGFWYIVDWDSLLGR